MTNSLCHRGLKLLLSFENAVSTVNFTTSMLLTEKQTTYSCRATCSNLFQSLDPFLCTMMQNVKIKEGNTKYQINQISKNIYRDISS